MPLKITDRPGCITAAQMQPIFEREIRGTPALAVNTPLGAMEINGAFSHYMDADTDTMWLGFAIGMRAAERIERAKRVLPVPRKPTGFVAVCQCGNVVGAMDKNRTDNKDAGKLLGKWLARGCIVEPRFDGSWSASIQSCKCKSKDKSDGQNPPTIV